MNTSTTTAPGANRVWDLTDASVGPARGRRGTGWGGPVAATAGVLAVVAAVAPGLPIELRWTGVAVAGLVALPVGFSTLRGRLSATSLVLALVGVVTPFVAGVATWDGATAAPPAVRSTTVPDATMTVAEQTLSESSAFAALPPAEKADAAAFAGALALRLHALHGSWGPFPTALQQSQGSLVETTGLLRGAPLGAVPRGTRLEYEVAASGSAFRVTVVSVPHPDATVSATSALVELR
jgi:hypothetical protein